MGALCRSRTWYIRVTNSIYESRTLLSIAHSHANEQVAQIFIMCGSRTLRATNSVHTPNKICSTKHTLTAQKSCGGGQDEDCSYEGCHMGGCRRQTGRCFTWSGDVSRLVWRGLYPDGMQIFLTTIFYMVMNMYQGWWIHFYNSCAVLGAVFVWRFIWNGDVCVWKSHVFLYVHL